MSEKQIISRINTFIPSGLKKELNTLCENRLISDNNKKAKIIMELFKKYDVDAEELGPGTNRMAVLIDGYVFKIAMDRWGKRDNDNEYAMSYELQPFVIKVYETNTLITVSEYVTLISPEEFSDKRYDILTILSTLSDGYLIGDVGYHEKNFTNWGFRDNGELVILDFAYIYTIIGDEMMCIDDGETLKYDPSFMSLRCPKCRTKYTFTDVRRLVTIQQEDDVVNEVKASSYILKTPKEMFDDDKKDNAKVLEEELKKENEAMSKKKERIYGSEESYMEALELFNVVIEEEEVEETQPVVEEPTETMETEEESDYMKVMMMMDNSYEKPNRNRNSGRRNNNRRNHNNKRNGNNKRNNNQQRPTNNRKDKHQDKGQKEVKNNVKATSHGKQQEKNNKPKATPVKEQVSVKDTPKKDSHETMTIKDKITLSEKVTVVEDKTPKVQETQVVEVEPKTVKEDKPAEENNINIVTNIVLTDEAKEQEPKEQPKKDEVVIKSEVINVVEEENEEVYTTKDETEKSGGVLADALRLAQQKKEDE